MSTALIVRPAAEADLADARQWYERQRPGQGTRFVLAVHETFARIERMPEGYAVIHKDVRCALVRRFPYVVYYRLDGGRIIVLAIMHGKRHPNRWQSRH
jgi:plasmid stabilization system protein ParE